MTGNTQDLEDIVNVADAAVGVLVLMSIWPEYATIKLLSQGDARFVRSSHKHAEGL